MIQGPINIHPDWEHIDGRLVSSPQTFEADIVIIGTGAGGGVAAEELCKAGLSVLIVEMGPFKTAKDFTMEERTAYPDLYQEAAARKTKDKAISIFQGRCVGGSTTVNWTTSIRTPKPTQQFWAERFAVKLEGKDDLTPYFQKAEKRLNISPWHVPPNPNNAALRDGCIKLGWEYTVIARNVKGCANLGYCGMGCPMNAKQSMLVTTIPEALNLGATLLSSVYVEKAVHQHGKITSLTCYAMDQNHQPQSDIPLKIHAKQFIFAAGSIGTPAIMLRSNFPDPSGRLGKHTYLHPVVISGGFMKDIHGHSGAPQSIYSDEFVWKHGADGPIGYKLEVPPIHPVLIGSKLSGYGQPHADIMHRFNDLQIMLALLRDGFHPDSQGGTVRLNDYGEPILDYPLNDYLWNGIRRAFLTMAELQFASGAKAVFPAHDDAKQVKTWSAAQSMIEDLLLEAYRTVICSAHVMGGCNMGEDPANSVVNSYGQHHQIENLYVFDGSVFPTSLGANPQLSIYGLVYRNVARLLAG